jgi:hypothetical protein
MPQAFSAKQADYWKKKGRTLAVDKKRKGRRKEAEKEKPTPCTLRAYISGSLISV